jgi:hypothetical protein
MIKCKTIGGIWFILFCALMIFCCSEVFGQQPSASCTITTDRNKVIEWTMSYKNLPDISNCSFLLDSSFKVRFFRKSQPEQEVLFDAVKPKENGKSNQYYFRKTKEGANNVNGQLLVRFFSSKIDCEMDLAYDGNYHVEDHARIEKNLPILLDENGRRMFTNIKCSIEMMEDLKEPACHEPSYVSAEAGSKLHLVKQLVLNRY